MGSEELTTPRAHSSSKAKLLTIVIVLYRCTIDQSSTCRSLREQVARSSIKPSVLVYDNSPVESRKNLPNDWEYKSETANGGLARAYNYALSRAKEDGSEWLLLLDQDSLLPDDYLSKLDKQIASCRSNSQIAAIVPLVVCGHTHISPYRPSLMSVVPCRHVGLADTGWLSAINSGATVKVSFLESIGGFEPDFWLDFLDHWLFRRIFDKASFVYVMDVQIGHDLSVGNFNENISVSRYKNVLAAEVLFVNRWLPRWWRIVSAVRLAARGIKHLIATRDKGIASLLFQASWRQSLAILQR